MAVPLAPLPSGRRRSAAGLSTAAGRLWGDVGRFATFAETKTLHYGGIPCGHRDITHRSAGGIVNKGSFETIGRAGRERLRVGVAIDGLFAVAHPTNAQAGGRTARRQEVACTGVPRSGRITDKGHGDGAHSAALAG